MSNDFGIVIPHYERKRADALLVWRCLFSIKKFEPDLLNRTIIINDASPSPDVHENLNALEKEFPGITVMHNAVNSGFAKTINKGIKFLKKAKVKYILLLNNDVEICLPFCERVKKIFSADKDIAAVGNLLLYPTGRIQSAGIGLNIDTRLPFEYEKMTPSYLAIMSTQPRFVFAVTGAMQFLRTEHLDEVGLYDEDFFLAYEDFEFCYRAWNKGKKVFYDSGIYAIHSESVTRGYFPSVHTKKSFGLWLKKSDQHRIYEIANLINKQNELILPGHKKSDVL